MEEKNYLSKERYEELLRELDNLKTEGRKKIADRLKNAKELGDLSENSEYQEARQDQDYLEQKINQLENIIRSSEVIKKSSTQDIVGIGSKVKVRRDGTTLIYKIVGSNEANPSLGLISNESPIGMSLLGKRVGEEVTINTPKGDVAYKILGIE